MIFQELLQNPRLRLPGSQGTQSEQTLACRGEVTRLQCDARENAKRWSMVWCFSRGRDGFFSREFQFTRDDSTMGEPGVLQCAGEGLPGI